MTLLPSTLRRMLILPPRLLILAAFSAALILIPAFVILSSSFDSSAEHNALWASGSVGDHGGAVGVRAALQQQQFTGPEAERDRKVAELVLHGGVIMGKLKNETLKAELGRSSWKLLHTMAARFPLEPNESEKEAFKSFIYLFSRLYPCGECAAEFQALLKKHPPQTSSRGAASLHLCHLHNLVNARLGKEEFDCSTNLDGVYDCGCGDDPVDAIVPDTKPLLAAVGAADGATPFKRKKKKVAVAPEAVDGRKRDPATGEELIGG